MWLAGARREVTSTPWRDAASPRRSSKNALQACPPAKAPIRPCRRDPPACPTDGALPCGQPQPKRPPSGQRRKRIFPGVGRGAAGAMWLGGGLTRKSKTSQLPKYLGVKSSGRSVSGLGRHPHVQRRRRHRRRGHGAGGRRTLARDHRRRRWIERRHLGPRGGRGRDGRPAPVQQGQRRRGQERHPPGGGRVRADHRWRRPASAGRRAAARLQARRVRPRRRRARKRYAGEPRAEARQLAPERPREPPHGARDSRPDVRLPRRAARVPAGVPAPPPQRVLHADHDHAGVHQGRLQRRVRADGGAGARRHSRRSGWPATARSSSSSSSRS